MNLGRIARSAWLVALPLLLDGCVTQKLWQEPAFNEPAPSPNMRLFQAGKRGDVLVEYDESCGRNYTIRRRAYLLYEHTEHAASRCKPRFVNSARTNGLRAIPVVSQPETASGVSTGALWAATSAGGTFTLFSGSRELGSYDLPLYRDRWDSAEKALITPLTVVADAAIAATIVGIYWMAIGAPGIP
jgi:hypothetical protein